MKRDKSENLFYDLLLSLDIDSARILEPDKDPGSLRKEPDFIVGDIAFEVKSIVPSLSEKKELADLTKRMVEHGEVISYWTPLPRKQFVDDLKNATKKFQNHPNFSTMLVEDLTDWFPKLVGVDTLIFGQEAIHLNSSNEFIGRTWKERTVQTSFRQTIGAYMFMRRGHIEVYHNLHAHKERRIPRSFSEVLAKHQIDQHFFSYDEDNRPTVQFLEGKN